MLPEESHKYAVRRVFRSFDEGESAWRCGRPALYRTLCVLSGVGGSVDRIAGLYVII